MSRWHKTATILSIALSLLAFDVSPRPLSAQQTKPSQVTGAAGTVVRHLAAGEFHLARRAAKGATAEQRGSLLGQIALAQAAAGDSVASARTAAEITDSAARADVLRDLQHGMLPQHAAAGGGAMADFASLMQLISSTIAPDTWDLTAAGPSSMAPYPGGIFVDGAGVIRQADVPQSGDPLPAIVNLLRSNAAADSANRDWTAPAELRCVSLRRLSVELVRLRSAGLPLPASMQHLAGISEVHYLIIDRQRGDALLAGPVGGIDLSRGWAQDRQTSQTSVELHYLTATLRSARERRPLGCSIDPAPEAIAAAAAVAQQIRDDIIPLADGADRLAAALGRQRVMVFGTATDTPLAWLLVEADRHMKQLALGQQPMPEGVPNYLDIIDAHRAAGPPATGQLLRMWFTAAPITIRADAARSVFQLTGLPLQLATENQVAGREGRRQPVADDPRAVEFADQFNERFAAIAAKYPAYAALASLYRAAGVAALLHRHTDAPWMQRVCGPLLDEDLVWPERVSAPRQVDSIAVAHHFRHGNRRHHVLVASGGVMVSPEVVMGGGIGTYPTLQVPSAVDDSRPAAIARWWWDAAL